MMLTHSCGREWELMAVDKTNLEQPDLLELLGYVNFSSGTSDPQFLRNLNALYETVEASGPCPQPQVVVGQVLLARLGELAGRPGAFEDAEQARAVLRIATEVLPKQYRAFHRDLLFHLSDAELWRPFFLGRACEAVLSAGGPWNETDRIVESAIAKLNDYIGHRPVAVLQSQRIQPYAHEWIRPIPLYVREAGVGAGRYHDLIERALAILHATDAELLAQAYFDPANLDELALDPRAYDFDHPVNKRPNYHFGQWDPHHIDNRGHYRRFVLQQVTLDVLLDRGEQNRELPREQLLAEAAAVLAGTMLMASGTSANGPNAHNSATTLSTLLPRIARYRDAFYERFIARLDGEHGERLRAEAIAGKQPLAAARQHLNQQLARRRAAQLEHVHLALLFARMGYPRAALHQAQIVPVAAARMACEIQCRLTTGHLAIDAGRLEEAQSLLVEAEDFLRRAIECGALVDPWNILGFQGNFSLFPSPENSVPDHRLEQLVEIVEQIVGLNARLWSEAAARDDAAVQAQTSRRMQALARWWDKFAPTSVESIEGFSGSEAFESARHVAEALQAFHRAGAASGDIAFWRQRVEHFNSPKAYALVVGALWQKPDLVAAMALLMQWLSQAGLIPLKQGEYSFYAQAQRWMSEVCLGDRPDNCGKQRRAMAIRFFDLLEANAEEYWRVPALDLLGTGNGNHTSSDDDELTDDDEDDEEKNLYRAAYDEVVYIDSTGDGVDADMLESGPAPDSDFELEAEARRVGERLAFLRTVASLWKKAVLAFGPESLAPLERDTLDRWLEQARDNEQHLLALLKAVEARSIPAPRASRDSLLEFDRRRSVKESLIDKVIGTTIDTSDAARSMRAALPTADDSSTVDAVLRAAVRGNRARLSELWPQFLGELQPLPLLYVPLGKGGDPNRLAQARALQQTLRDLLQWLPRLGLLGETCQLIEAARLMESANPVGSGAISEYDRLFAAGYESIVEAVVAVSHDWPGTHDEPERADNDLVECLELATESLLKQWLAHSRTLRLSVLERLGDDKSWQALVAFIESYGADLFTQRFLNMGNLRGVLHQGVDAWLTRLEDEREEGDELGQKLLDDLADGKLKRADAVKHLSLVIESVVENYAEYRDYNSTTTQSDRGDLLYTMLDFLRLRVHYDRVAWHLKPVMIAHSVLVRRGRTGAAEIWRRALAERTGELADSLEKRCAELRKKYAMRLPTVTDRVAERFTRPLAIDRIRALIKPAMDDVRRRVQAASTEPQGTVLPALADDDGSLAFQMLEEQTDELTQEPTGVGLDVPAWLQSLEQEVDRERRAALHLDRPEEQTLPVKQTRLTMDDVLRQFSGWERQGR